MPAVECSECGRRAAVGVERRPLCLTCALELHEQDEEIILAGVMSQSIFRDMAPKNFACAAALLEA